jgi:predicted nucleic acid-binding Zn ribbon protein
MGVNEGTLSVSVDSPAWMYQMRIRQTKILKQLKEEVSEIKQIRFKIGTIKP